MLFFRKKKSAVPAQEPAAPYFHRVRDAILQEALRQGAAVIRIEPAVGETVVHLLHTGQTRMLTTLPARLHRRLAQSFRGGAGITQPSDTEFSIGLMLLEYGDERIDAYTVLFPTPYGSRITVRLVPRTDPPAIVTPWDLLQV